MKFIKAHFDNATIVIDDTKEIEMDVVVAIENVRGSDPCSLCYLAFPSDNPGRGCPIDKNISREEYLKSPAKYGVALYKNWNGTVTFE